MIPQQWIWDAGKYLIYVIVGLLAFCGAYELLAFAIHGHCL